MSKLSSHSVTLSFLNGHRVEYPILSGVRFSHIDDLLESEVYRVTDTSYLTHRIRFFLDGQDFSEVSLMHPLEGHTLLHVWVDVRDTPLLDFPSLDSDSSLPLTEDDNWLRTRQ